MELLLDGGDVGFESLDFAISYLSHTSVVTFTFCTFSLYLEILNLLLVLLNLVDESALTFPLCAELILLVAQFGYLLVELCEFVGIILALDGLSLNLQLLQASCYLVEFLRH